MTRSLYFGALLSVSILSACASGPMSGSPEALGADHVLVVQGVFSDRRGQLNLPDSVWDQMICATATEVRNKGRARFDFTRAFTFIRPETRYQYTQYTFSSEDHGLIPYGVMAAALYEDPARGEMSTSDMISEACAVAGLPPSHRVIGDISGPQTDAVTVEAP